VGGRSHDDGVKVLVLESEPGAAQVAEQALLEADHTVVRCHPVGLPAFPCIALSDGRCPLDEPGVDVAVTVRGHVHPRPAPLEDGAVCALRRAVPLVTAGRTALNPFAPWSAADVEVEDVVTACEEAVRTRSSRGRR
jgi:hypothetical protein